MSIKAITDALYTKLTAVQSAGSLYAAVGGRIYMTEAPPNTPMPLLIASVLTADVQHNMGVVNRFQVPIQFDIWVNKTDGMEDSALDIETKLFDLLDRFNLTVSGFDRGNISFTNRATIVADDDAYHVVDECVITATDH